MIARWKFRKLIEVLGPQRFRDRVLLIEPLAQVNQLAAMRTEGPIFTGKPIAALLANRAFDLRELAHRVSAAMVFKSSVIFVAVAAGIPAVWRIFWASARTVFSCAGETCEPLNAARANCASFVRCS